MTAYGELQPQKEKTSSVFKTFLELPTEDGLMGSDELIVLVEEGLQRVIERHPPVLVYTIGPLSLDACTEGILPLDEDGEDLGAKFTVRALFLMGYELGAQSRDSVVTRRVFEKACRLGVFGSDMTDEDWHDERYPDFVMRVMAHGAFIKGIEGSREKVPSDSLENALVRRLLGED